MASTTYQDIKKSLHQLYLEDNRPWLVGFSGGKDNTMLASLVVDAALLLPPAQRTKPISVVCTDKRVEIPAIVEMVEGTLRKMQRCPQQNDLRDSCLRRGSATCSKSEAASCGPRISSGILKTPVFCPATS